MKGLEFIQLALLISLIITSRPGFSSLSYGRGGGETLDPGEAMKRKVAATEGDQVVFSYEAESTRVECGIIFLSEGDKDDIDEIVVPLNITLQPESCLYYDVGLNGETRFVVPKTGIWLVVVINTSPVNQNVRYDWEGTEQSEVVFNYAVGFSAISFLLIVLGVLFIRRKN